MTPKENQPGEPQNLDGPEPQVEYHTPPNVEDGVKRYDAFTYTTGSMGIVHLGEVVLSSDHNRIVASYERMLKANEEAVKTGIAAERAKRLDAERDAQNWKERLENVIGYEPVPNSAELLALRGGKVGEPDLGGNEVAADGGSKPTSAHYFEFRWGSHWYAPDDGSPIFRNPLNTQDFKKLPEKIRFTSGGRWEDASIPSPEPAAIPKTTTALVEAWWNDYGTGEHAFHFSRKEADDLGDIYRRKRVVHLREVTGEGRRVSAEQLRIALLDAMELIRVLRTDVPFDGCNNADEQMDFMLNKWGELLYVLSEEGGRQKEGGTEIQIPNTLEPKS